MVEHVDEFVECRRPGHGVSEQRYGAWTPKFELPHSGPVGACGCLQGSHRLSFWATGKLQLSKSGLS